MPTPRKNAFTIVELLVVIGILATLVGILLPALAGAQKRSLKGRELNQLRQVGVGWTLYANSNKDRVLPGFLEREVQGDWRVVYKYPNGEHIPPATTYSQSDPNLAGPWSWRLASYVDFNHETLHGYADEPGFDVLAMSEQAEAAEIALYPSFGYNAYYVGGWWELVDDLPKPRFYDAMVDIGTGTLKHKPVVSQSLGSIKRSSDLITFASSARLEPGVYRDFANTRDGWNVVVPPFLADEPQWREVGALEVLSTSEGFVPAPIGRYNGLIATVRADGRTEALANDGAHDMRLWVDRADDRAWNHQ